MLASTLADVLARLREARVAGAKLEALIKAVEKPHLEAAANASAALRRALAPYTKAEEAANAEARELWTTANDARNAALLEGVEAPKVAVPEHWIVQGRDGAVIRTPGDVPREYCEPSKALVTAALKAKIAVPGAKLVTNPVFVYRAPKTAEPQEPENAT